MKHLCKGATVVEHAELEQLIDKYAFLLNEGKFFKLYGKITLEQGNDAAQEVFALIYDVMGDTMFEKLDLSIPQNLGRKLNGHISIPENITYIDYLAFADSLIQTVSIPHTVLTIGERAFRSCHNLEKVSFRDLSLLNTIDNMAFADCDSLVEMFIPGQVRKIGRYAFKSCSKLASIYIPNSVTYIGHSAFIGCSNLTIYCKAERQPATWHSEWNPYNRPVVWGV